MSSDRDIICLYESWILDSTFPCIPPHYWYVHVPARKVMLYGRASGGILILYNDKYYTINVILKSDVFIFLNVCTSNNNFILGVVYRPQTVKLQNFLEELSFSLEKLFYSFPGLDIILGGDFNCRVAQLNQINNNVIGNNFNFASSRCSCDTIYNNNGNELTKVLESYGFLLLNGITKKDSQGNFTYVSSIGSSVIDLVWVSLSGIQLIDLQKDEK